VLQIKSGTLSGDNGNVGFVLPSQTFIASSMLQILHAQQFTLFGPKRSFAETSSAGLASIRFGINRSFHCKDLVVARSSVFFYISESLLFQLVMLVFKCIHKSGSLPGLLEYTLFALVACVILDSLQVLL
jgi:hypothetical protein